MNTSILNIGLSFIEGFALILSPCIGPILPIILAGSLTGSKQRPVGIIIGFVLTFALFSYFAHTLIDYTGINTNLIRHAAYALLLFFGIILSSTFLTECFNRFTSKLSALGNYIPKAHQNQLFSGLFLGGLISLIWTPCAGPILAAVIVQIIIQKENIISFFMLLAFALGAAIPMLIIAFYSLKIRDTFTFFKKHAVLMRKLLGIIIILNVLYMVSQELGYRSSPTLSRTGIRTSNYLQDSLWLPYTAPRIEGITKWVNSPSIELSQLKGKVVLIDFWTYSCINCIRTLPYLKYWYEHYHPQGLQIIGIHSPEFDFEKDISNVKKAVKDYGIEYPVALDNQFITWSNFSNHYWPAHYLINKEGKIVYVHFGEGNYDVMENNIRFLLGEDYSPKTKELGSSSSSYFLTPETYLGYARADSNANRAIIRDKSIDYSFPSRLKLNQWALDGSWQVAADKIISSKPHATVEIHFNARYVYVVMGGKTTQHIKLLLNNKPITIDQGKDVVQSHVIINKDSIYNLLALPQMNQGILQIIASEPGLELYTFTFGN